MIAEIASLSNELLWVFSPTLMRCSAFATQKRALPRVIAARLILYCHQRYNVSLTRTFQHSQMVVFLLVLGQVCTTKTRVRSLSEALKDACFQAGQRLYFNCGHHL